MGRKEKKKEEVVYPTAYLRFFLSSLLSPLYLLSCLCSQETRQGFCLSPTTSWCKFPAVDRGGRRQKRPSTSFSQYFDLVDWQASGNSP